VLLLLHESRGLDYRGKFSGPFPKRRLGIDDAPLIPAASGIKQADANMVTWFGEDVEQTSHRIAAAVDAPCSAASSSVKMKDVFPEVGTANFQRVRKPLLKSTRTVRARGRPTRSARALERLKTRRRTLCPR
jgi:hypothetical protein